MTRLVLSLFVALSTACGPVMPSDLDAETAPDAEVPDAGPVPDVAMPDAPAPADTPDASPATDTPTPDAPGIDTSTPEGFARRSAELHCAAWVTCAGCMPPPSTCVATMTARQLGMHDPGVFRPELVGSYLEALEDALALCQQLTVREFAMLFPYRGDGRPPSSVTEPGDLCETADDCTTRNCQPYREMSGAVVLRCDALPAETTRGGLCE